jgi:hypothetical protein
MSRTHAVMPMRQLKPGIRRVRTLVPRLKPFGRWIAGVVAAVLAAVLTAWLLAWGPSPEGGSTSTTPPTTGSDLPFTVAVQSDAAARSWISDQPMAQIPARPGWQDDWWPWVRQVGAVDESPQDVFVTVQGRTEAQVTLTDLRVRVVERRPAIRGTRFGPAGGGGIVYRWVSANLDADPPKLSTHVDDGAKNSVPEHERRPIRFPYRVSVSDAETFEVLASTEKCDCSWVVELSWVSEGRLGTYVVDDGGKPFRVTGASNVVQSCLTGFEDVEECGQ